MVFASFFTFIGVYATLWYLYENLKSPVEIIVSYLKTYLNISKSKSLTELYGEWAVVTGATDGIGKQYARQLARKGMKIVLISRSESKLIEVAKDIESTYSVKTKYITADFGDGMEIYNDIKKQLQTLDIGVLINNVGVFHEFPDYFHNIAEDELSKMININIGATIMMSRIILPQMKKNQRGIIVNISSGSEFQPIPLMSVYSSSKIFVTYFTLALQQEFKDQNIDVQLVSPMFIKTKLIAFAEPKENFIVTNVESFVQQAVFTMGRSSQTTGYWSHGIQVALIKLVPQFVRTQVAFNRTKMFRNRFIKRQKLM